MTIKELSNELFKLGEQFGAKLKVKYAHEMWHATVYDIHGNGVELTGRNLEAVLYNAILEYEQVVRHS